MSDTIIKVENVGKSYLIGHQRQQGYTALRDVISQKVKGIGKNLKSTFSGKQLIDGGEIEEFWALKDINFEIKAGEAVGIIGRNGAGKSTLLKVLSRITEPTKGKITLNGRVASLLEVGTGFHPELTGRENIFLNGAILGMGRSEITRKFDEIVDFSGVERFLDTPVKRYSSGMYVRLAFAVAAHLEPEILIVDEVLAVGDADFQKKCMGKIKDVSSNEGRTVLFVSHNMAAITNLCTSCLLMKQGQIEFSGPADQVIERYMLSKTNESGEIWGENIKYNQSYEHAHFNAIRVVSNGIITNNVEIDKEVIVEMEYEVTREGEEIYPSIHLLDAMGSVIFATFNGDSANVIKDEFFGRKLNKGVYKTYCKIPANFLNDSMYSISAFLVPRINTEMAIARDVIGFSVIDSGEMRKDYAGGWIGAIRPKIEWNTQKI